MNRGRIFGFTLVALAAASACSLFHSLDDLTNGGPHPDDAGSIGNDATPTTDGDHPDSPIVPGCAPNTDYQNDFKNCGRCNHDCLGGECRVGVCQPIVVTSSPSTALELLVHGGSVYYANAGGEVWTFPIGDETSTTLANGQGTITGLATDGVALYWAAPAAGKVFRCQLAGGCGQNPQVIASGQAYPTDVAWDPVRNRVVWTEHGVPCDPTPDGSTRGDVRSALTDGGDPQVLVVDAGTFPSRIAATNNAVYWSVDRCGGSLPSSGTLWNVTPNGNRNQMKSVNLGYVVLSLAADDAGTGFSVEFDHSYTTGIGTGPSNTLTMANPQRIALDDTFVYWTTYATGGIGFVQWRRRSSGAGAAEGSVTFTKGGDTGAIGLSDKAIYFAHDNRIMALAKP